MKHYDKIYKYRNGVNLVKLNDNWGMINEQGIEICPLKYDYIDFFDNEFFRVKLNNKWGVH
jgi:hypothetical protein